MVRKAIEDYRIDAPLLGWPTEAPHLPIPIVVGLQPAAKVEFSFEAMARTGVQRHRARLGVETVKEDAASILLGSTWLR